MTMRAKIRTTIAASALVLAAGGPLAPEAGAQVERVYHPMYLPADHNWEFRTQFPAMDRLFNAFDYGHGILYETLWSRPDAPEELLEEEIYRDLTQRILPNPPRLPMPEASFMPRYARLVPLAKEMFEWAHILHKQSYDILADRRLSEEERDRAMAELLDYYLTSDLAFPDVPKGMEIMDEQHFSKAFRERYPKFNGLIWAYHWLQVAAYEPLLAYDDPDRQRAAMDALLARFWQMLEDPPEALPSEMPMTPAIAPAFTERYPEFAAVFDNLHMMHDVISDVLVSERVPRGEKRAEIYRQADLFRDPEAMAVSRDDWIAMALAHGLEAQGGPAVGWLPEVPTRGAAPHDHHVHPEDDGDPDAEDHEHDDPGNDHDHAAGDDMHRFMEFVLTLLDDDGVMERIHADHELHRLWEDDAVQEHLERMRRMHRDHEGQPHGPRPDDHHEHHGHEAHQGHEGHRDTNGHEGHGDPGTTADGVRETVAAFHAALADGDPDAALDLLDPDVRVYEQGHPETLEEYRAGHLEMDMAFAQEVEREVVRDEVVEVHGGALYLAETRSRGTFQGREVDSSGVETAFLLETPDGWRIRHFHWSSRR
jgi:ketosteroid isomerase-like protein